MKTGTVYFALVHYPVYNREGEIVSTSVTPLDVHDLGRIALTYGAAGYYITNPLESQRRLVEEIILHWRDGLGGEHSPQRKQAVSKARMVRTVADAFDDVWAREGREPFVAATTAREFETALSASEVLPAAAGRPVLVLFGTGYGLADDLLIAADAILKPLRGPTGFNHLPVRAAIAIYAEKILAPAH